MLRILDLENPVLGVRVVNGLESLVRCVPKANPHLNDSTRSPLRKALTCICPQSINGCLGALPRTLAEASTNEGAESVRGEKGKIQLTFMFN